MPVAPSTRTPHWSVIPSPTGCEPQASYSHRTRQTTPTRASLHLLFTACCSRNLLEPLAHTAPSRESLRKCWSVREICVFRSLEPAASDFGILPLAWSTQVSAPAPGCSVPAAVICRHGMPMTTSFFPRVPLLGSAELRTLLLILKLKDLVPSHCN